MNDRSQTTNKICRLNCRLTPPHFPCSDCEDEMPPQTTGLPCIYPAPSDRGKPYIVRVMINRKLHTIGTFATVHEAATALGEFRRINPRPPIRRSPITGRYERIYE